MNKISKYFFLNIYNTNPPTKRLSFNKLDKLIENKDDEDGLIAILIACNKRNMPNYLQHSIIKNLCDKLNIEVNEDSIKELQNEAIFHFLQSNNKKRILSLIAKLKNNNIIFYEEEQNIRISIRTDKNISLTKTPQIQIESKFDFNENNAYMDFIDNLRAKIEGVQNTYLKNKISNALDDFINKTIFSIAVLGLKDSGKQMLIKALNEISHIDKTNGILHISNKNAESSIKPSKEILEILEYYDKENIEIQNNLYLQSQITKQNIDIFKSPSYCNAYTKIYAQTIINKASLILYLIDVDKEINDKDIEIIIDIFRANKSLAIVFTHFDLINPDELKIIKESVINKLHCILKRYKISEIEIINKINFLSTASNISLMYLQDNQDLALSKGFRQQDSGIYILQKYIKETLFGKKNIKLIIKDMLFILTSEIKIYIQMLQRKTINFHIDEDLIQDYKNNLESIKNKIDKKILVRLNVAFEAVSQNDSRIDKKILLKVKITDSLNEIFKIGKKDFEKINMQFLNKIKYSNELDRKQLEVVILRLNMLKSLLKKTFILDNNLLISQSIKTLNTRENLNKKDMLIIKKAIMCSLNLEEKIDSAILEIGKGLNDIKNMLGMELPYNPNEIKNEITHARQLLNSIIIMNNDEYNR